jgi:heme O synthase-like polyprenyltransferase
MDKAVHISEDTSPVKHTKLKDYFMLMKANLSFLVVFSSLIGYYMAPGTQFILKYWPWAAV